MKFNDARERGHQANVRVWTCGPTFLRVEVMDVTVGCTTNRMFWLKVLSLKLGACCVSFNPRAT